MNILNSFQFSQQTQKLLSKPAAIIQNKIAQDVKVSLQNAAVTKLKLDNAKAPDAKELWEKEKSSGARVASSNVISEHGGTIDAAKQFIQDMDTSYQTITLGSSGTELYSDYTPAIGYGMGSYQDVFKNTTTAGGHSITLQAIAQAIPTGKSITGYGVMETSWDVYYMGNIIGGEYEGSDQAPPFNSSYSAAA